jgi:hypothetical protein
MRSFIAATLFTAALAAPHYGAAPAAPAYGSGYGTGEESSVASYPAPSSSAYVPEVPVSTPEASSTKPGYGEETPSASSYVPEVPSETPYVPGYGTPSETPVVSFASLLKS